MFDPKGRAKWDAWKGNEGTKPISTDMMMLRIHYCLFSSLSVLSRSQQLNIFFLVLGKSQDDAMNDYITKVKQMLEAAGMAA